MGICTSSYTICNEATKYLSEAIEREPNTSATTLFPPCVPLRGYKGKSRSLSELAGVIAQRERRTTAASKTPRKNLIASAPEKFETTAKRHRTSPHAKMLNAEYLAMGRRCRSRFVGHLFRQYRAHVSCSISYSQAK